MRRGCRMAGKVATVTRGRGCRMRRRCGMAGRVVPVTRGRGCNVSPGSQDGSRLFKIPRDRSRWLPICSTRPQDRPKTGPSGHGASPGSSQEPKILQTPSEVIGDYLPAFSLPMAFRGLKMAPRWPKRASREAQKSPKTAPRAPKSAPRAPQEGPKKRF